MKIIVAQYLIEQSNDTIMIKDAKSKDLLKAKVYRPQEVDQKFKDIVAIYEEKFAAKGVKTW